MSAIAHDALKEEIMEGMPTFAMVKHAITDASAWQERMSAFTPEMMKDMHSKAHSVGLFNHSTMPTNDPSTHFCLWEMAPGVNVSSLQAFLKEHVTVGLCEDHIFTLSKGHSRGLPPTHFPSRGYFLVVSHEVEDGLSFLQKYRAKVKEGFHQKRGIVYELASIDEMNPNKVHIIHRFATDKTFKDFNDAMESEEFQQMQVELGVKPETIKCFSGRVSREASSAGWDKFLPAINADLPLLHELQLFKIPAEDAKAMAKVWDTFEANGAHNNMLWRGLLESDSGECMVCSRFPAGAGDPYLAGMWGQLGAVGMAVGSGDALLKGELIKIKIGGTTSETCPFPLFE